MKKETKLILSLISAMVFFILYLCLRKHDKKPPIQQISTYPIDYYVKGYYDGRTAIYNSLQVGDVSYRYLDSAFTSDSLKFIEIIK